MIKENKMAQNDKFDEFLEEVENDIRQEKYYKLWEQYGKYVTSFITVSLVVLAGYSLWSNHQDRQQLRNSDYYIAAQRQMAEGKLSQALALLKEIQPAGFLSTAQASTYHTLAKFSQGAILQEAGDQQNISQAIEIYQGLSQDKTLPPLWKSMAILQSIRLQFQQDPMKASELIKDLAPLTQEGHSLQAMALEQTGIMLQQMGKTTEAADVFVKLIQMKDAPEGVSMRAQIMVQKLGNADK